ncbi:M24 family metallopeptidase [Alicyclobacillus herbarius]|uniref:M24 family metallopeptidase n=1 Tax=Alicyclobacillus herbarius TaxID=122960 RepID=UPI00041731F8|nr:M24 family metallopeptidase [Alicyclobacillus herbarius]
MTIQERVLRVRSLLEEHGLDGLILEQSVNLAWLFGGRYHVNVASEQGLAAVFITHKRTESVVTNIEQTRLVAEEGLQADTIHTVPWYDAAARNTILETWRGEGQVMTDADLREAMLQLRIHLDDEHVAAYRRLGRVTAWAVEEACRTAEASDTEADLAGKVASLCVSQGLDPLVLLVAGERRAGLYRHPLPTSDPLGGYTIVSLCARSQGLVAAATRTVAFDRLPEALARRYEAVLQVEARMLHATRPGVSLSEVLRVAQDAYAETGFADAWTEHHQGGLIGFQSRELRADLAQSQLLSVGNAVAWNPSLAGAKAEDTFLLTDDGLELLTPLQAYPEIAVDWQDVRYKRPWILVKNL